MATKLKPAQLLTATAIMTREFRRNTKVTEVSIWLGSLLVAQRQLPGCVGKNAALTMFLLDQSGWTAGDGYDTARAMKLF